MFFFCVKKDEKYVIDEVNPMSQRAAKKLATARDMEKTPNNSASSSLAIIILVSNPIINIIAEVPKIHNDPFTNSVLVIPSLDSLWAIELAFFYF